MDDNNLSRHERREQAKQQKEHTHQSEIIGKASQKRKKKVRNYSIAGIIIVVIVAGSLYSLFGSSQKGSELIPFAQCITDNGAIMYGAFWCPHCSEQKALFGSSFDNVNYVECDARGKNAQPELCNQNDIQSYPTWIFQNEERSSGVVSLERLSAITGCQL